MRTLYLISVGVGAIIAFGCVGDGGPWLLLGRAPESLTEGVGEVSFEAEEEIDMWRTLKWCSWTHCDGVYIDTLESAVGRPIRE